MECRIYPLTRRTFNSLFYLRCCPEAKVASLRPHKDNLPLPKEK